MTRIIIITIVSGLSFTSCVQTPRDITINFSVDMSAIDSIGQVGIVGEYEPMNWDTPIFLADENDDDIYTTTITIKAAYNYASFKFTHDGIIELEGKGNRKVTFEDQLSASYEGIYDKHLNTEQDWD